MQSKFEFHFCCYYNFGNSYSFTTGTLSFKHRKNGAKVSYRVHDRFWFHARNHRNTHRIAVCIFYMNDESYSTQYIAGVRIKKSKQNYIYLYLSRKNNKKSLIELYYFLANMYMVISYTS